jgi:ankyrin repeat protein
MEMSPTTLEQFDNAVRAGDALRARELLAADATLHARLDEPRFDFNSPAIHQAKKNLQLVDVLLEHGANINARSTWWAGGFGILEHDVTPELAEQLISRGAQLTPWAAAGLGKLDELKAMLAENPSLIRERGGDGKTLLHFAADVDTVRWLIDSGAQLEARDVDHGATPLQHQIGNEPVARLLIERGARPDIFAAIALNDDALIDRCLREDPTCADARIGAPPVAAPGGHIYGWTLQHQGTYGFDLSPMDVARVRGHEDTAQRILPHASAKTRFLDACWHGDEPRARAELAARPPLLKELDASDHQVLPSAAWWYRPAAVRLMLDLGFNPHTRGAHQSTPLDRASFHGYADIVGLLLEKDPHPPLEEKNEFGGTPISACVYGATHGWRTGHPQDHLQTVRLLLKAGSRFDAEERPTGHAAIDALLEEWLGPAAGR